ncbi:MAG: MCP four helix bundle domain-containing protein [Deltaproteobacteria bacterium]|nr:MCP four helix bundle domain-containing protein [Deltaproteobacteria bacterium]
MKAQWTIGKKLLAAFIAVAAITLVLGIVGYYGAVKGERSISLIGGELLPSVDSLHVIKENAENIRGSIRTLIIPGLPIADRQRQYTNLAQAREAYQAAWKTYEALPQTKEEADAWKQFGTAWNAWRDENNKLVEISKQFDSHGLADPTELTRMIEQFTKDHYMLVQRVLHLLYMKDAAFAGGDDHSGCNAGKWIPTFKTDNQKLTAEVQALVEPHRKFHEAVGKIKRLAADGKIEEGQAMYQREMMPAMQEVFKHFDAMLAVGKDPKVLEAQAREMVLGAVTVKAREANEMLDKIVQHYNRAAAQEVEDGNGQAVFLKLVSLISMIIGVAAALTLGVLITRSINSSLSRVIAGLNDGAQEVASAAGQVSSAAQSLAEGSSEQAASIEETSSSLEEMSSMTKQNADNAGQANTLMGEAKQVVGTANESMGQLTESMAEITKASEETSKIIKTIDEIAFQTNLLALNAAVEAARAGEAGAGFAVVADEVRNLAMRAADAAKNTANLIEGTVKKVKDGSELVGKTNEAFKQVAGSSAKAADLVAEISAASNEQAQGIGQINTAVTELDKVTQQNAANAEESASAAEEMSAQAETMKGMVDELQSMVGGSAKVKEAHSRSGQHVKKSEKPQQAISSAINKLKAKAGSAKKSAKPVAEAVIPLDDDKQFSDF